MKKKNELQSDPERKKDWHDEEKEQIENPDQVAIGPLDSNRKWKVLVTSTLVIISVVVILTKLFPKTYVSDIPLNSRDIYTGPPPDLNKYDFSYYDSVVAFFEPGYYWENVRGITDPIPYVTFTNKHIADTILAKYTYLDNELVEITDSVLLAPMQVVTTITRIRADGLVRPVSISARFKRNAVQTEVKIEMSDEIPKPGS